MGQYFIAVNQTKKEYIRPWDIGGLAKLFEWCANHEAGIFPFLLRKSDELGGGDIEHPDAQYAGRWAGDEVYLVGDYDSSGLYDRAQKSYRDIARGLVREYNRFIKIDKLKLKHCPRG